MSSAGRADDSDNESLPPGVGRAPPDLQALLARLAGGSGMSFMSELSGIAGFGSGGRFRQVLEDLSADDPDQQDSALRMLRDQLLMGNEDTLGGFRPEQFVPVLHRLIDSEGRPGTSMMAIQTLANMLEAIPTSSSSVASTIESLCGKLLSIEYAFITYSHKSIYIISMSFLQSLQTQVYRSS